MTGCFAKTLCLGLVLVALSSFSSSQELPKLYELFTEGGIQSGLVAANNEFRLNGKYIRLISGGIHYFRVHPDLWRDRLRKLRALGANAVETYVSWNLHEPRKGEFDFGNGNNDFSAFMNIRRFVQMAQEEDLLVIIRPGPYICAEWDFGGMPSWLLRDPNMEVRGPYPGFTDRVKIFLEAFLSELVDLQFTRGGPIIALQVENEYASFGPERSREYLEIIRDAFLDNQFGESLFFTADNGGWVDYNGAIPGVLQTANAHDVDNAFGKLLEIQPDMPLMVMEFYPGWSNHWTDASKGSRNTEDYLSNLEKAFGKYNGSINLYMFHGGTNLGFMAGANWQGEEPNITFTQTTYDFDALLTEAGDYSKKYDLSYDVMAKHENPKLYRPERPAESRKVAYPTVGLQQYLTYNDIIEQIPDTHKINTDRVYAMEDIPINNFNGQSYGYIIYRKTGSFQNGDRYKVTYPKDFAQLIVDGVQVDTGFTKKNPKGLADYWINGVKEFPMQQSTDQNPRVDLMVENCGRIVFGWQWDFYERKGMPPSRGSKIEINDQEVESIQIISAEFTNSWAKNLSNWRSPIPNLMTPILIRSTFTITGEPADTFLDMREWHKGIVYINGFNIGRYWKVGPQETLYVPAPLLKTGENEIIIFEQLEAGSEIKFLDYPILGIPDNN